MLHLCGRICDFIPQGERGALALTNKRFSAVIKTPGRLIRDITEQHLSIKDVFLDPTNQLTTLPEFLTWIENYSNSLPRNGSKRFLKYLDLRGVESTSDQKNQLLEYTTQTPPAKVSSELTLSPTSNEELVAELDRINRERN
jgi:hypothetical protein